jgi:hypothetical protein
MLATPSLFAFCAAGADLSGLLELPQRLRSLSVGGQAFGDAAMPVLVHLTQLEYLCVHKAPGFTDTGLQQLTALELDRLYVYGCALTDAVRVNDTVHLTWDEDKVSGTKSEPSHSCVARCSGVDSKRAHALL